MDIASAVAAEKGSEFVLNRIDAQRRLSMIYDQGREMDCQERLVEHAGVKSQFYRLPYPKATGHQRKQQ